MRNILRLIYLFMPAWLWLLLGLLVAVISLALGVGVFVTIALQVGAIASGAALRLLATSRVLARYFERLSTHDATFRVIARLRLWLFRKLIPLAPLQLGMQRGGATLSRLTADIDALDGLFLRLLLPLALFTGACTAGLYWLALWNITAALSIGLLLVLALCILALLARQASPHHAALMTEQSELRSHIVDGVEGLSDLMANGAGHQQAALITRSTAALVSEQLAVAEAQSHATLLVQLLQGLVLLVIITLSWPLLEANVITPATLLLTVMGYLGGAELLAALPAAFMAAPRLAAATGRIFEIADITPLNAEPAVSSAIPADLTLGFKNISLSYNADAPALNDVSFTIKPGERVAIMGASGAGKSSLAMLLLKFISPTKGKLLVGGTDIAALGGDVWRSQISYLSQHTRLIAGTLRDNLRLAKPDASTAELQAALAAVELESFMVTLPLGLETWIGEDGLQLSGGQARRVALAMVLLKNAPIWLLDEPTEGLDETTAEAVLTTIHKLTLGRTLLLITHDAAMLQPLALTRLILLDEGKISSDSPI